MLPLSPALLSFSILAFASVILAQTLTFTWPKYPEAYVSFPLTWSGGTPPYTVYVLTSDLEQYYYKYQGGNLSTSYNFPLSAGTEIAFQCRDSSDLIVTSPTITVIATLYLRYPRNPQTGVLTTIQWGGGMSPYIVYVLNANQTKYYWKYSGSETSQFWTPDMAAGTEAVFQIIDYNGAKATSYPATVYGYPNQPSDLATPSESITTLTSSTYHYPGDTYTAPQSTTTFTTPAASNTSGVSEPGNGTNGGKGPNMVAIVVGVVGGVVGLTLAGALWISLAKQGSAGREGGAQMEMGDNDYVGAGGQGGNSIGQPAVDPFGDECAPNAGVIAVGAGDAGIGGAVQGVSENPFMPERQLHRPGGIHSGAHTGAGAGAADYIKHTRNPSSNKTQQPFPTHAIAASTGGGPSQLDTSDSDSGYGPGSSLFPEHQ